MTVRKYSSRSQKTTLTSAITSSSASISVVSATALMGGKTLNAGERYTVVIDPDTAIEEIVQVYKVDGNPVAGNTLAVARGIDGSIAQSHSVGAEVRHMAIGQDYQEANDHIKNETTAHGLTIANVLETTDTNMITTAMLQSNSVTTVKITDANVTTAKIADSAVTSAKIADLTIATGDIADGAITSAKIADLTIATGDIADSAITTAKIAAGAVVTADIADLNVTTGKIADSAITSAKIADGTIVNADINTSAQVAYGKLNLTNSIVNADINASAAIALSKLATDPLARANHTGTQTASTISDFDTQVRTSKVTDLAAPTASFSMNSQKITDVLDPTSAQDAATKAYADTKIAATEKGAVNGVATLGSDGKLTTAQIPDVTITDTSVVSSQAAMLALTAQVGDVAVRTDLNKSFILKTAGASTLANWQELLTPTDAVQSVDGQTGTVNLSSTYATVANAANKLPLAGGTMSGAIAMGTNKITGLGDPTLAQDAATKNYIDTVVLAPSNLTGPITSVGNVTSIASQTGTGTKFVVDTSPTLVTPVLGVATATSINGTTIPSSKTLVATDSTQYVVPSQTGNTGKYLTTDGTTSSWGTVAAPSAATPTVAGILHGESSSTLANPLSVGYNALVANTTGTNNTAIGSASLDANTSGSNNTALGFSALGANIIGASNTAVGNNALLLNTASNNTAVGAVSLDANTSGAGNTAMGAAALGSNTTGNGNTAVGLNALASNTSSSDNTAIGNGALSGISTTSPSNTAIGSNAGSTLTGGQGNIIIGNNAQTFSANSNFSITLGSTDIIRFRIPGIGLDINKDIELMNIMGAY